jgi:hypothetical protein
MALKTLQCCGNAKLPEQMSALRAIHTLNPSQKLHLLARGVVTHPFEASARSARPHVGCLGAISAGGAMVMMNVMPVVFVLRLLKNAIKTPKLVVCNHYNCNSRNTKCSMARAQVVW